MADAKSPTGSPIRGTLDQVPGIAIIEDFSRDPETGDLTWQHAGETKMHWDGQAHVTNADGEILFVDENADIWPQSQLVIDGDNNTRAES